MAKSYRNGFSMIGSGIAEVACVTWSVIITHKAISALVVSVLVNIGLTLAYMAKCDVLSRSDERLIKVEMQNDSLRHADVKYFPMTHREIAKLDSVRMTL